jgi:hypothetical protein
MASIDSKKLVRPWTVVVVVRLSNFIIPYMVICLPKKELPLITYLLSPQLRVISVKKEPLSSSAILTPPWPRSHSPE